MSYERSVEPQRCVIPHSELRIPHWVRTLHIEPFVDSAFPNPHSAMEETLHLSPAMAIANYQSLTPKTVPAAISTISILRPLLGTQSEMINGSAFGYPLGVAHLRGHSAFRTSHSAFRSYPRTFVRLYADHLKSQVDVGNKVPN